MMMQHHALTKDGISYDACLFVNRMVFKSNYHHKSFLIYLKSSEQKLKMQLSDVVTRIANDIRYNTKRG
jgi:cell fate (sporulation/competence/biofilm development) regulator YlbF (YheA/YmcA/DUF963 family)